MQIMLRNGNMKFKLCPPRLNPSRRHGFRLFFTVSINLKREEGVERVGGGGGGVNCDRCKNLFFFHQKLLCSAKKKDFVSFDFVV